MDRISPRRDPYRLIGEVFSGRYLIDEFFVAGSFGAVYRATDKKLGRAVAIKILKPDLKDDVEEMARELFQREALAAGALRHPHIVAVTDVGEDFGIAYLVMEWLEGRTLEEELRRHLRISLPDTTKILKQITSALQLAHEQNIVHRDIKPSNIHLGKPEEIFVKVLDFGIAKVTNTTTNAVASRIAGTFAYMPPEQIEGNLVDARTDIYALGVLLFQMLSGELPFKKESEGQLIQQQIAVTPPRLTDFKPEFSSAIADVIEKALQKNPEDRQQSVVEIYESFVKANSATIDEKEIKREAIKNEFIVNEIIEKKSPQVKVEERTLVEKDSPPKVVRKENITRTDNEILLRDQVKNSDSPNRIKIEISNKQNKFSNFYPADWTKKFSNLAKNKTAVIVMLLLIICFLSWLGVSAYNNYQKKEFGKHLVSGNDYLEKRQYDLALIEFDEAVNINPGSVEARKSRADAHHFLGESEKAIEDYSETINLGLKNAEVLRRLGYNFRTVQQFDRAITDYSEAINLEPKDYLSYIGRCQIYFDKKEFDNALTDCNKAIGLDPSDPNAFQARGNIYLAKNENNSALADFNSAIRLQPANTAGYLGRANSYLNKNDLAKALEDYNEVLRLEPDNLAAFSLRGLVYQKKNQHEKAIVDFGEALRLNPEHALLYFSRGKSYLAKQELDSAIADFDKAIELHKNGKIEDYFFERGIAHLEKKEYDKAIADWTEVINLDPKSFGAYHNRGVAYARQGKRDLAEMDFRKERELKGR